MRSNEKYQNQLLWFDEWCEDRSRPHGRLRDELAQGGAVVNLKLQCPRAADLKFPSADPTCQAEYGSLDWFDHIATLPDRAFSVLDGGSTTPPHRSRPMTFEGRRVWNALAYNILSAEEIALALKGKHKAGAITKRIERLNKDGYDILNLQNRGYYRPDAPPPEMSN